MAVQILRDHKENKVRVFVSFSEHTPERGGSAHGALIWGAGDGSGRPTGLLPCPRGLRQGGACGACRRHGGQRGSLGSALNPRKHSWAWTLGNSDVEVCACDVWCVHTSVHGRLWVRSWPETSQNTSSSLPRGQGGGRGPRMGVGCPGEHRAALGARSPEQVLSAPWVQVSGVLPCLATCSLPLKALPRELCTALLPPGAQRATRGREGLWHPDCTPGQRAEFLEVDVGSGVGCF